MKIQTEAGLNRFHADVGNRDVLHGRKLLRSADFRHLNSSAAGTGIVADDCKVPDRHIVGRDQNAGLTGNSKITGVDNGFVDARAGDGEIGSLNTERIHVGRRNRPFTKRNYLSRIGIGSLYLFHCSGKGIHSLRFRITDLDRNTGSSIGRNGRADHERRHTCCGKYHRRKHQETLAFTHIDFPFFFPRLQTQSCIVYHYTLFWRKSKTFL